jgi:hypothetical protein
LKQKASELNPTLRKNRDRKARQKTCLFIFRIFLTKNVSRKSLPGL